MVKAVRLDGSQVLVYLTIARIDGGFLAAFLDMSFVEQINPAELCAHMGVTFPPARSRSDTLNVLNAPNVI